YVSSSVDAGNELLARRIWSPHRIQQAHQFQAHLRVIRMAGHNDTLLPFGLIQTPLEDIEPDDLPAKLNLLRIELDKLAQQGLDRLEILYFFEGLQLKIQNAKIFLPKRGITIKNLERTGSITSRQLVRGKDNHCPGVRWGDRKGGLC